MTDGFRIKAWWGRAVALVAFIGVLSGCASSGGSSDPVVTPPGADPLGPSSLIEGVPPLGSWTEGPDIGGIGQLEIPSGYCGMLLSTRSGTRAVPIFRSTQDGRGLMNVEGQFVTLELIGRGGTTYLDIPSIQYFRGQVSEGYAISVAMSAQWGEPFPGGTYVNAGMVTVRAEDGWERMVPVAGIAGCKR